MDRPEQLFPAEARTTTSPSVGLGGPNQRGSGMRRHNVAIAAAGVALALSACVSGTGDSAESRGAHAGDSGPSIQVSTRLADYETFESVSAITRASQLVLSGTVVGDRKPADRASQTGGGAPVDDVPSVVSRVKVDKIYKGSAPSEILVIQRDPARIQAEPSTLLKAGERVVLFLNDPGIAFEGVPVHAIYGNDQGYVTVSGEGEKARPTTHLDPLPLPPTLSELEVQIKNVPA